MPSVVARGIRNSPVGVLAVDLDRPGEADRDLSHAGEVLDIAFGHGGIERVREHVLRISSREITHELPADLDDLR